ncbi:molybdopterin biosynthesis protein MoeB [Roseovarius sp. THAF8]|uniref:rhodanese-like domain-containing protein n=1 Tax=Roseovarius sp. THAF8 TaxID=2587846 RepID=UPI001268EE3B|nr:rhodanese-like domain-containing protein [Roseovarius sp. THAF8]QFT96769.1 molybdopterin biosynthesis protein MoeB [Roseovarius sp. THAF8]
MIKYASATELKDRLDAHARIGLIDVREHGQYGEGHLLFASNCPYSRLELRAPLLLPDRKAEIYLYDEGEGVAERAADRLACIGYEDVLVLRGGLAAWQAAGYGTFKGVNVPSKVLGELVEVAERTPQISAEALEDLQKNEGGLSLFDGRPARDYRKMTVPGSRHLPNGEMLYRFAALGLPEDQPVVIHCAGRTRGLIGVQSLINAGIRNPVYAMENGTQGWALSGRKLSRGNDAAPLPDLSVDQLEQGRAFAERFIARYDLPAIGPGEVPAWRDEQAYVIDVRSDAEFAAGHVPGAVHAPVVQLVQATDEWVAMRRARIALFDDNGVRAALAAFWLRQLGHDAVVVMDGLKLVADDSARSMPERLSGITCVELARLGCSATVIDLRSSMAYRAGHIPGALWAIRPRAEDVKAEVEGSVVLVADDSGVATLFASELDDETLADCRYLEGGMEAWTRAGGAIEVTPERPADDEAIDFLFFVHDRHDGNLEASRRYLEWETGLVRQLDLGERRAFKIIRTKAHADV